MINDLNDLPPSSQESIELELLKIAAASAPSEGLAIHIVAYKALGIRKSFAIFCMSELARRRSLGEEFNYETYIDEKLSKIPKIETKDLKTTKGMFNIRTMLNYFRK